jgi:hypothetical protein
MSVHHGAHIFVTSAEATVFENAKSRMTFGWPLVVLGIAVAGADHLWNKRRKASSDQAAG